MVKSYCYSLAILALVLSPALSYPQEEFPPDTIQQRFPEPTEPVVQEGKTPTFKSSDILRELLRYCINLKQLCIIE